MFTVYKLTNIVNGKSYIGITSRTVSIRWSEHIERSRHGVRNSRIYDAIRKYGQKAFTREALATAETEDEIRRLETHYIKKYDTYENGYNSNLGGVGFLKFPDHIRRKISESQKGKIVSSDAKEKMSLAKKGDRRCALHFGEHTKKGGHNPRAKTYLIKFPDGSERIVRGLLAFCRDNNLCNSVLRRGYCNKGYVILKRFNDYPEREYAQAGGNGGHPVQSLDGDIVSSA